MAPLIVKAVHTFVAEHGDELEFTAGEEIVVLEKDEAFGDGWWRGQNAKGEEGLFPMSYIEVPRTPEPPVSALPTQDDHPPSPRSAPLTGLAPPVSTYGSESPKGTTSEAGAFEPPAPVPAAPTPVQIAPESETHVPIGGLNNKPIESYNKDSDDEGEFGINQDTRARLAEQSKIANAQRENRASGAVAGLVYSDESDDDEEDNRHQSLTSGVKGLAIGNGGDGVHHAPVTISAAPAVTDFSSPTSIPPVAPIVPLQIQERSLDPALPLPATPPMIQSGHTPSGPAVTWTVSEVVEWAKSKGFDESVTDKFKEHEISGDLLLELDANLLKELDIPQFGKRLRIAQAISELRRPSSIVSNGSQQPSPGFNPMSRGVSGPPMAVQSFNGTPTSTPPMSATEDGMSHGAWAPRKTSSIKSNKPTAISAIREEGVADNSAKSISIPSSPVTPGGTKRESTGSLGHKKGKPSIDRERLSFFGRNRKAPPTAMSPTLDQNNGNRQPARHQMQPATPEAPNRSSGVAPGTATALQQIGKPDHSGYLKKKGDRYNSWKSRYFVLKGSHLYYMKSEAEDRVKGHIDLRGHRVIVDENTNPGSYGFRLVGADKSHFFSSSEQSTVREWMKALMKATIARDYSVPVTSSCNIPTIPLAEAQAMSPRPPSPAERDATQRATRRENVNQLTARDASVLMSLDTTSGQKRRASQGPSVQPRDNRRVSGVSNGNGPPPSPSAAKTNSMISNTAASPKAAPVRPPSNSFPSNDKSHAELLTWFNSVLPSQYPRANNIPGSFVSGEAVFLLVKSVSNLEPNPPVAPSAFMPDPDGQPGVAGLFAMMDILIDTGVDTGPVNLNDIRSGKSEAVVAALKTVKSWMEGQGVHA